MSTGGGQFSHFGIIEANHLEDLGLLGIITIIRHQETTITITHYHHFHHQNLEEG